MWCRPRVSSGALFSCSSSNKTLYLQKAKNLEHVPGTLPEIASVHREMDWNLGRWIFYLTLFDTRFGEQFFEQSWTCLHWAIAYPVSTTKFPVVCGMTPWRHWPSHLNKGSVSIINDARAVMSGCVDLSAGTRQLNGFVRVATMPPPAPSAPRRPTDRPHKMFQSRELRKPVPGPRCGIRKRCRYISLHIHFSYTCPCYLILS